MPRPKAIGNAGERNHRRNYLSKVWPTVKNHDDKYHPTKDHDNTGDYHVESKKRTTWNIKDVVREMEERATPVVGDKWFILYEDRNRTIKTNPSGVYAILPALELMRLLYLAGEGDYNAERD